MAVNNLSVYNPANDGMALPLSITRGNPNPLDDTYLYDTLANAQAYAASGATAYVGQNICVLNTDIVNGKPTLYVIEDVAGTLKPVGDAADIFNDSQFVDLKTRVDILDNIDDTVEGSVANALDQSKVSIVIDPSVTNGVSYNIYQGSTITKTPDVDSLGDPILDAEGNQTYTVNKTPIKIGTIGIQDLFVTEGSVVGVEEKLDSSNQPIQATDENGALVFEDDGVTPVNEKVDTDGDDVSYNLKVGNSYLKLILSNGSPIYVPTASLAKGLANSVKLGNTLYRANSDGIVEIPDVSTDLLSQGVDTLVLVGGNAIS